MYNISISDSSENVNLSQNYEISGDSSRKYQKIVLIYVKCQTDGKILWPWETVIYLCD